MSIQGFAVSLRLLYWLTAFYGVIGFVSYFAVQGPRPAVGFAIGALGSFGNLWLFNWLSRSIAPGDQQKKPWQAGTFIGRYLILFLIGYATVKALDVNPLPVVFGLFSSTAAVLTSIIVELIQSLRGRQPSN